LLLDILLYLVSWLVLKRENSKRKKPLQNIHLMMSMAIQENLSER
jgi:hypothetical protein